MPFEVKSFLGNVQNRQDIGIKRHYGVYDSICHIYHCIHGYIYSILSVFAYSRVCFVRLTDCACGRCLILLKDTSSAIV